MKTAFVFPGQGSQFVGMGKDLVEGFDEARDVFAEASRVLGYDLNALCFEGPKEELDRTERTQPALLTVSVAACRVLMARGVRPDTVAGHSLGEYSALVAAGSLEFSDAVTLTEARARLMQEAVPAGEGLMAAVLGMEPEAVQETCASVETGYVAPANYNCPGQIVISGDRDAVEEAMELLREAGAKRVVPLAVSVPSHSALMDGAARELAARLEQVEFKAPSFPLMSNAEARLVENREDIRAALVKQLNHPVLWEQSVVAMHQGGVETFVEVGPGKVLTGLAKRIIPEARTLNVQDTESLEATLEALGA